MKKIIRFIHVWDNHSYAYREDFCTTRQVVLIAWLHWRISRLLYSKCWYRKGDLYLT